MYSDLRQTMCSVKDGIEKEYKLVLAYLFWSAVCTYWGVWNACDILEFYGMEASAADLLIAQQDGYRAGIMIFPAAAFVVMKCKQNSLSIQLVLRYGSRRKMLVRQIMESMWYAVVTAGVLLGTEFLFAWTAKGTLINWNSKGSIYYAYTGELSDAWFITAAAGVFCMYVIKMMILFVLTDIFMWYPKTLILLWVLLVLVVELEKVGEIPVFHFFFSIHHMAGARDIYRACSDRNVRTACGIYGRYQMYQKERHFLLLTRGITGDETICQAFLEKKLEKIYSCGRSDTDPLPDFPKHITRV